ncbi:MAG: carbohydrate porin [Kofleriaceae bacterium]|nr:carbohydrate porin [Kofleriaceae bacterium]
MRVAVTIGLVCASTLAHADAATDTPDVLDEEDEAEEERLDPGASSANKPGFQTPAVLTGDWGGVRSDLYDAGFSILPSYSLELFGAPQLVNDPTAFSGLFALELDADLSKLIDSRLGRFYTEGFAIHGDYQLTERLREVFGVSNTVAPPDVRLFEAWLEQPVGPIKVRGGLLSADQEFLISEQSSALIDATFGIITMFSVNIGGPIYPVATPGLSARYESDALTVRAAIYDGDQINSHGIPTSLGDSVLGFVEVTALGTFKLGGWSHTTLGSALYGVIDRQLDDHLGTFVRGAVASKGPVEIYLDAGIRIDPGKARPNDVISVGIGFADGDPIGAQTLVEGTYQAALTGWLVLQPDVQVILRREGLVGVLGARLLVTF